MPKKKTKSPSKHRTLLSKNGGAMTGWTVPAAFVVLVVAVVIALRGTPEMINRGSSDTVDKGIPETVTGTVEKESCSINSVVLEDFDKYFDFFAEENDAVIVVTPHNDKEGRLRALLGTGPCVNKRFIALLSPELKGQFRNVLQGNKAIVWGPRSKKDPVTEPNVLLTSDSWLDEIVEAVRGVEVVPMEQESADNARQKEDIISKIRRERSRYLPRVPPLGADGTRPIERRDNLSTDELLSYVLWGVPVIITDATDGWGCMNWTYDHIMSNYPHLIESNQNVLGSGRSNDPNVAEPNAWENPYFLRESQASIDKGMFYSGKKDAVTPVHNDFSCDLSVHATISGAKQWHVFLGDALEQKLRKMQAQGYEGVPFSSKDAPWVGTVLPGEMILFNQVMMHEVHYVGDAEDWNGSNAGVAFYFDELRPLFFHDDFWDELMEMQGGMYENCRHNWYKPPSQ